jgi:hypothetical protein
MFRHFYRAGLTPDESELLRKLRHRGFALALIPPCDVGGALNRKPVEDFMLRAGRQAIKQMEVSCERRSG